MVRVVKRPRRVASISAKRGVKVVRGVIPAPTNNDEWRNAKLPHMTGNITALGATGESIIKQLVYRGCRLLGISVAISYNSTVRNFDADYPAHSVRTANEALVMVDFSLSENSRVYGFSVSYPLRENHVEVELPEWVEGGLGFYHLYLRSLNSHRSIEVSSLIASGGL